MAEPTNGGTHIGRSVPRLEAWAKLTGRADYVHSYRVPGMLHGKIVRSTLAHGRVRRIDVAAAQAVPGVHRVITAQDVASVVASPYYGPAFHDQPILAIDKVRHVGEPVALVLAADPHVAEEAARLVEVEYDELPAVFGEVEAMTSRAIVHDVLKPAGTFPDLKHLEGGRDTNVALDFRLRRGDVDAGFAAADHVFEHTFTTQQVLHVPLEPPVSVAEPGDRTVTIHTSSQTPSFVRSEVARLLGWPESRVRVKVGHLGGSFGAKLYIKLEALVTAAALIVRRPVRIALTMEEQFYTITKHASTLRIKSGVTEDGRIVARACEVWWNGGAYAEIGPRVTQKSGFTAAGPYDIDNVRIDSYQIYTNLPPAGALRGFGVSQLVWAYESHTDMVARAIGMDPLAFRRKNLLHEGRPQATGTLMRDAALDRVLERLAAVMAWEQPFDRGSRTLRRGRGLAIGFKASISPTTSVALVTLQADGSCVVACGTVDMGQGSDTAMAMIAAEVLRIPLVSVRVVHPDTDVTPYDMATLGSRSTYHMGHAVRRAAEDARARVAEMARAVGLPETAPIADVFRARYGMKAGTIVGTGSFMPPYSPTDRATGQSADVTPNWMIGATGAEVDVDVETGQVRVTKLVNVVDAGTAINPRVVETQVFGAALMQLGFTLFEEMVFDGGQVTNASFADYKIPGMLDVPATVVNEAIDAEEQGGPFGAKGVGESGTFSVSPAVANALDDAVGVRLTSLPITAEAVYRAMRDRT
jgi:CO/xanthine dehydrogenase Mo-binding subunit